MLYFTEEINEQIELGLGYDRLNGFLAQNDQALNKVMKTIDPKFDRFNLVAAKNKISRKLTPYIHENFHGKHVVLDNGTIGVIEHPLTRTYGDEGAIRITENCVSFREHGISLWVNTGDRYTTHLYKTREITLASLITI